MRHLYQICAVLALCGGAAFAGGYAQTGGGGTFSGGLSVTPTGNVLLTGTTAAGTGHLNIGTDGASWRDVSGTQPSQTVKDIAWNGTIFCAVGGGTDAFGTSPDGYTWTARTGAGSGHGWERVAWVSGFNSWVAVSISNNDAATSPDCITWTLRTGVMPANSLWRGLATDGTMVVAMSDTIHTAALAAALSLDGGLTWAAETMPSNTNWDDVTWSPTLSKWLAVGNGVAATSTNATSWSSATISANQWQGVTCNTVICAASSTTGSVFASSTNGTTWTDRALSDSQNCGRIVWNGTSFISPGITNAIAETSPDALTWTKQTMPSPLGSTLAIAWAAGLTTNSTTLGGCTWASPCTLGSTTPNTGAFTTVTVSTPTNVISPSQGDFAAYRATKATPAATVTVSRTIVVKASTLTTDSVVTPDVVGVGGGNFVLRLCSDGTTCGAGNIYLTCTIGCAATVGTPVACSVTKSAVAASTTLSWEVGTACATTDPGVNMVAHFTTP